MRALRRGSALVLAVVGAGCARLGLPEPTSGEGDEIVELWRLFFWAGLGVFVLVGALILVGAVRYRARPDRPARPTRERVAVEVAYTLASVALVTVLFVFTLRTDTPRENAHASPDAVVHVEAFNWSWRFVYPEQGVTLQGTPYHPPELVLPAPATVRFVLTSADVVHSFYVPAFLFKLDAVPGRVERFDVRVTETGTFRGVCAEFCGFDHHRMRFVVRAVPPDRFEAALAAAREAVPLP